MASVELIPGSAIIVSVFIQMHMGPIDGLPVVLVRVLLPVKNLLEIFFCLVLFVFPLLENPLFACHIIALVSGEIH